MPEQVRQYTLHQRRLREQLERSRSLDDLKAFLDETVVGSPAIVSDFRERTLDERRDALKAQALDQYHATLRDGFDDGSGTMWTATPDARNRILDLTQRIQEYRAGKASSELPNGKSTVRLRDANDNPHSLTPGDILDLAERGDDFIDAARDRLDGLYGDIAAATSHANLDAIDVTAGWPG